MAGAAGIAGNGGGAGGLSGSSGQSGFSGQKGGVPLQPGEYELTPDQTLTSGYAQGATSVPRHLTIEDKGTQLVATVSYEGRVGLPTPIVSTEAPFTVPTTSGQPLTGPYQADGLVFTIDEQGHPSRALHQDFWAPGGFVACNQSGGAYYLTSYVAAADTLAPSLDFPSGAWRHLQGAQREHAPLPWRLPLLLSEPAIVAPPSSSVGQVAFEQDGLVLNPRFEGDLFALLGQTVTLTFPSIQDRAGHTTQRQLPVTFADPGPAVAAKDYSTTGDCSGLVLSTLMQGPLTDLLQRFAKPGATRAILTLCTSTGSPSASSNITAVVTAQDGKQVIVPLKDDTTVIDLPADDVVIEVLVDEPSCRHTTLKKIELQ